MTWSVITVNPQGHSLPQPATDFEQAWILCQPPVTQAKQWVTKSKEEVEELFAIGGSYVYVAIHDNGTIRMIHKDL